MIISGQAVGPEVVERINIIVGAAPSISRRALSRRLCEEMDWRSSNGRLQEMSCRKALAQLERQGLISLPPVTKTYAFEGRLERPEILEGIVPKLDMDLSELGQVELVPVSSRYSQSSKIWNGLMKRYHYLGNGPLCGCQIRYLVRGAGGEYLGGLSFSSAAYRLKARDHRIGWSDRARHINLNRVVCNSRFLILPTVNVPNLASHVLSLAMSRLGDDWEARYGVKPLLVETFVDPKRYKGTCYLAANWIEVGYTAGRSTQYANGKVPDGKKRVFLYPLSPGWSWQKDLCREPKKKLGLRPRPREFRDWTEEEFGSIEVYDERLKERLFTLANDFYRQPGALVPQACDGSKAKIEAAYRFFNNDKVSMDSVIRPHIEATAERMKQHAVVLAVQDTTTLNYTAHPSTEGLGPINTQSDGGRGFIVHDTMAFSTEGTPLGLLDVQCWARDPKEAGKSSQRKELPIEQKESIKWLNSYRAVGEVQALCPDTMLVSVGDREADVYELFHEATSAAKGPELLVRADRGRQRRVGAQSLWEKMAKEKVAGHMSVHIPRSGSRKARVANLEVRHAKVTLTPPQAKPHLPPITVWAVYATEIDYGAEVTKPIDWLLLTTVKVSNFKDARERMSWYAKRWGIEVYHRTMKSGCRIEDRRLGRGERLETCLAIDMVVAWRVFFLTMQGRETPKMPCDTILSEEEWKALCAFTTRKPPPAMPPPLQEAVIMIASLGGFMGRKGDGYPGTTTVWRGLKRLEGIAIGFAVGFAMAGSMQHERDGP